MRPLRARVALAAALGLVLAPATPATAAAPKPGPKIEQLVVFRDGAAKLRSVRADQTSAELSGRSCAVPRGTPLSGLLRSKVAGAKLRDFGSCSSRTADAAGLFVSGLGPDRNKGDRGWVYKVGRKAGTAGAADPTGPFGRGLLERGDRVTWFYCLRAADCQPTLEIRASPASVGGAPAVSVRVRGYDDKGRGADVPGATVHFDEQTAVTGANGLVTVPLAPGIYDVYAEKQGFVRSFTEAEKVQ